MNAPKTTHVAGAQASESDPNQRISMTGVGLTLGISMGAAFGISFDATGAGISIGMITGLIIGAVLDARAAERDPSSES